MILFLDYDGVLHPDAAYLENGKPVLKADGQLFMWTPLLAELLMDFPKVKIVLSTSWVRELRFSRARGYLPDCLAKNVIGATWHSAMQLHPEGFHKIHEATIWDSSTRYEQIKRYADRAKLENWVAVDDNAYGWAEQDSDHLVHTDGRVGISDPAILSMLRTKLVEGQSYDRA